MASRLILQQVLEELIGSKNVYYQPPPSMRIKYPAIVYSRSNIENRHADNQVYSSTKQYEIIVIDEDPDSTLPDKVNHLPSARFNRHYTADNLNHDVFTIYF